MSLADSIQINISVASAANTTTNINTPLILTTHAAFSTSGNANYRSYTSASSMLADGFLTTDQAYIDCNSIFSQKPSPPNVIVALRGTAVAQSTVFAPASTTAGTMFLCVTHDGTGQQVYMPFTSSATLATSLTNMSTAYTALVAAMNGLTPSQTLGWTLSTSSTTATITSSTAGQSFTAVVYNATSTTVSSITTNANWANVIVYSPASTTAQTYQLNVVCNSVSTTMNITGSATLATTMANALTAYNTLTPAPNWTLTSNATSMTITPTTPGQTISSSVTAAGVSAGWSVAGVGNFGVGDDLNTLNNLASPPSWFLLLLSASTRVDGDSRVAAKWIEGQNKMFFAQAAQANSAGWTMPYGTGTTNMTISSGTAQCNYMAHQDLGSTFNTLDYNHSACFYHSIDGEGLAAAAAGVLLGAPAASLNMDWKSLTGITPDVYTDGQVAIIEGKNANGYRTESGHSILFRGAVGGTNGWIDVTYGIFDLQFDMQSRVYSVYTSNPKVSFDQTGIALLSGAVIAALKNTEGRLIAKSYLASDGVTYITPAYQVVPPLMTSISQSNRALRVIPSQNAIVWSAVLSGGINSVVITGTLTA